MTLEEYEWEELSPNELLCVAFDLDALHWLKEHAGLPPTRVFMSPGAYSAMREAEVDAYIHYREPRKKPGGPPVPVVVDYSMTGVVWRFE